MSENAQLVLLLDGQILYGLSYLKGIFGYVLLCVKDDRMKTLQDIHSGSAFLVILYLSQYFCVNCDCIERRSTNKQECLSLCSNLATYLFGIIKADFRYAKVIKPD